MIAPSDITAGILAGGEGRRLGGIDKGWYEVAGRPLVEHTIARLAGQAGELIISANRELPRYRGLGHRVVVDVDWARHGPLAGIERLLASATTPYLLVVPVDTPALPLDLAARLAEALDDASDLAVACSPERVQPLHVLLRRDLVSHLADARRAGVARVGAWQSALRVRRVMFEDSGAFANVNTEQQARAVATRLRSSCHDR